MTGVFDFSRWIMQIEEITELTDLNSESTAVKIIIILGLSLLGVLRYIGYKKKKDDRQEGDHNLQTHVELTKERINNICQDVDELKNNDKLIRETISRIHERINQIVSDQAVINSKLKDHYDFYHTSRRGSGQR